MQHIKNQIGFTLVELLVGMAIMTIIMGGLFNVLSSSIRTYQYSQKRTYEGQQARTAFLTIVDDIRHATDIDTAKGTSTFLTYTDNSTSLAYTKDSAPFTLAFGTGEQANTLMKGTQGLTTNNVKSILFKRDDLDGRIITITITLNDPVNTSSNDYVLSTDVFSPNIAK